MGEHLLAVLDTMAGWPGRLVAMGFGFGTVSLAFGGSLALLALIWVFCDGFGFHLP